MSDKEWNDVPEEIRNKVITLEGAITDAMTDFLETEEDLEWAKVYFTNMTINSMLDDEWKDIKEFME